ncbi:hypothetical protein OAO87_03950 [bacterium]|nr:hypothetical protein [bacterium]
MARDEQPLPSGVAGASLWLARLHMVVGLRVAQGHQRQKISW